MENDLMTRIVFFNIFLMTILLANCKSSNQTSQTKIYQDLNFNNDQVTKSAYLVDTVTLIDSYIYVKKTNDQTISFLSNNPDYITGNRIVSDKIYDNPDIYLMSHCLYCHLDAKEIKSPYDFEKCIQTKIQLEDDNVTIYRFSNRVDRFIIALMNISYYNNRHSSLHGSVFLNSKNYKSAYIKVAFPYCP
jgi:hypothetical protein